MPSEICPTSAPLWHLVQGRHGIKLAGVLSDLSYPQAPRSALPAKATKVSTTLRFAACPYTAAGPLREQPALQPALSQKGPTSIQSYILWLSEFSSSSLSTCLPSSSLVSSLRLGVSELSSIVYSSFWGQERMVKGGAVPQGPLCLCLSGRGEAWDMELQAGSSGCRSSHK